LAQELGAASQTSRIKIRRLSYQMNGHLTLYSFDGQSTDFMFPDTSWQEQMPRTIILAACSIANECWKFQGFDRNMIQQLIFDAARFYVYTHRVESRRGLLLGQPERQADLTFCTRFAEELMGKPGQVNEFMQMLVRYCTKNRDLKQPSDH